MKICALTICDDDVLENFGGNKLINSWKYFHPDVEIVRYGTNDIDRIISQYPKLYKKGVHPNNYKFNTRTPYIKDLYEAKKPDLLICLDADSIILNRLDEVLEADYDIAGVRNDGDHIGNRDESLNRPFPIHRIPNHLYLNGGLIAIKNFDFLWYWNEIENYFYDNFEKGLMVLPLAGQGAYNLAVYTKQWDVKILDGVETNLYYGTSANFPISKQNKPESLIKEYGTNDDGVFNLDSWKTIKYENNKFFIGQREVKVLHQAGGGKFKHSKKLDWDLFPPEIVNKLKEITNDNSI